MLNAVKRNTADMQAICPVASPLFRLEMSALGSSRQRNTRAGGGELGAAGLKRARRAWPCSAGWSDRAGGSCQGVPRSACTARRSLPPGLRAGRWPLAHVWWKYSKVPCDCGSVSACETERKAARFFTSFSQTWDSIKFQPFSQYISQNLFLIEAYNPTWCNEPQKHASFRDTLNIYIQGYTG